mgnify:CR=1 FL=1
MTLSEAAAYMRVGEEDVLEFGFVVLDLVLWDCVLVLGGVGVCINDHGIPPCRANDWINLCLRPQSRSVTET